MSNVGKCNQPICAKLHIVRLHYNLFHFPNSFTKTDHNRPGLQCYGLCSTHAFLRSRQWIAHCGSLAHDLREAPFLIVESSPLWF